MITKEIALQINNLVVQKPRTIQEIAQTINKNWRTAKAYVDKIAEEQGTLATRTFRENTKGALKIVYWNLINKNQSNFQERIFQRIVTSLHKEDFSPFDIYQHIEEDKRESFLEEQENNLNVKQDLINTLTSAEKQVLIFSGDLSWAKAKQKNIALIKAFEDLIKKNIPIKMIANIDFNSRENLKIIKSINDKYGQELIEIKHCQQPLRAFIIDNKIARFKEKYFFKSKSINNYLFYSIKDQEWIAWLQKLFWHFFSSSISAEKRLTDLDTIHK